MSKEPARTCSIGGCDERHHAKGLCVGHYWRQVRHGDPVASLPLGGSLADLAASAAPRERDR